MRWPSTLPRADGKRDRGNRSGQADARRDGENGQRHRRVSPIVEALCSSPQRRETRAPPESERRLLVLPASLRRTGDRDGGDAERLDRVGLAGRHLTDAVQRSLESRRCRARRAAAAGGTERG